MLQPQSISGKGETNTSTFTIWKSWLSLARSADSIFINVKHALGASGASRTSSNRRVKPEFGLHMDSTKALYQHRNRAKSLKIRGGQGRNRTADASLFRAALYQLSYLAGGNYGTLIFYHGALFSGYLRGPLTATSRDHSRAVRHQIVVNTTPIAIKPADSPIHNPTAPSPRPKHNIAPSGNPMTQYPIR
jgi:hypothetical protein